MSGDCSLCAQDFRIINMSVSPAKVKDTAELFYMQNQRKISLRYLAWYFLNMDVQVKMNLPGRRSPHDRCMLQLGNRLMYDRGSSPNIRTRIRLAQAGNHDSIEDSRAALALYRKYEQVSNVLFRLPLLVMRLAADPCGFRTACCGRATRSGQCDRKAVRGWAHLSV